MSVTILQLPIIFIAILGISSVPGIVELLPVLMGLRDFVELTGTRLYVLFIFVIIDLRIVYIMGREISQEGKLGLTDDHAQTTLRKLREWLVNKLHHSRKEGSASEPVHS